MHEMLGQQRTSPLESRQHRAKDCGDAQDGGECPGCPPSAPSRPPTAIPACASRMTPRHGAMLAQETVIVKIMPLKAKLTSGA